jgi:hypothetical protein
VCPPKTEVVTLRHYTAAILLARKLPTCFDSDCCKEAVDMVLGRLINRSSGRLYEGMATSPEIDTPALPVFPSILDKACPRTRQGIHPSTLTGITVLITSLRLEGYLRRLLYHSRLLNHAFKIKLVNSWQERLSW